MAWTTWSPPAARSGASGPTTASSPRRIRSSSGHSSSGIARRWRGPGSAWIESRSSSSRTRKRRPGHAYGLGPSPARPDLPPPVRRPGRERGRGADRRCLARRPRRPPGRPGRHPGGDSSPMPRCLLGAPGVRPPTPPEAQATASGPTTAGRSSPVMADLDDRRVRPEALIARWERWLCSGPGARPYRILLWINGMPRPSEREKVRKAKARVAWAKVGRSFRFLMVELAVHSYRPRPQIPPPIARRPRARLPRPGSPSTRRPARPIDYPKTPEGELADDLSRVEGAGRRAKEPDARPCRPRLAAGGDARATIASTTPSQV